MTVKTQITSLEFVVFKVWSILLITVKFCFHLSLMFLSDLVFPHLYHNPHTVWSNMTVDLLCFYGISQLLVPHPFRPYAHEKLKCLLHASLVPGHVCMRVSVLESCRLLMPLNVCQFQQQSVFPTASGHLLRSRRSESALVFLRLVGEVKLHSGSLKGFLSYWNSLFQMFGQWWCSSCDEGSWSLILAEIRKSFKTDFKCVKYL